MTEQPFHASALRGAVDLSGLQAPAGAGAANAGAGATSPGGQGGAGAPGRSGLVVQGTDANFSEVVNASVSVPAVLVLWSARLPESASYLDTVALKPSGKSLTPSADFQRLLGKKTLTKRAEMRTYETVVFTVPPKGKATLVAVDETLVSAKGE